VSIEPQLVTVLSGIVSGGAFPDIAPAGTALPYCTYQQVSGTPVNYLGAESSDKKSSRIQVNVWSATRAQAMTLIRQIEDAIVKAPLFGMVEGGAIATYDDVTKTRGAMQDFSFWA